ncbi:MAG: SPOR domain-containing protein [Thermonemataceae bacterium]
MSRRSYLFIIIAILFLTDCTRKGISQRSGSTLQDTLSVYRPQYKYEKEVFQGETVTLYPKGGDSLVVFNYDVTRVLDSLLDAKGEQIVIMKEMNGYRVQIYYGSDRNEAKRAREKSYRLFPDYTPYWEYKIPTYRVKLGDFEYREDALAIYRSVKKKFNQAIIVPDVVKVVKIATPDDLVELRRKEAEEKKKKLRRN